MRNSVELPIGARSAFNASLSPNIFFSSGIWSITAAGESEARYTGLTLGDVVVSTKLVAGDFGLTGDLKVDSLNYNAAAEGVERLDWNGVVDFDGDGVFETLDPGTLLTDPVNLAIDFESGLHFLVRGSVTGTDGYTTTKFAADKNVTYSQVLLRAGPVVLDGSAQIALSRWTLDVDVDGDGTISGDDLSGAQLDQIALSSSSLGVGIDGVLDLSVSGHLGLVRITAQITNRNSV